MMNMFRNILSFTAWACIFAAPLAGCKGGEDASLPVIPQYVISGAVAGAWSEGVTITLSSAETTSLLTDADGAFHVKTSATGTYTVTPSLAGYAFTPASRTIVLSDQDVTLGDFVSASSLTSYSVSGSITYKGTYGGPNAGIYIALWKDGQPTGRGTSIASMGTYTVRGVPAGDYALKAEMDILGTGTRNAADPGGTLSPVTVSGNLTGQDIELVDPVVMPSTPAGFTVNPGNQSAIIAWNGNYDADRKETATAYKIYSGPNSGSLNDSVVVPAYGRQIYFQSIPNGTYSFMISSLVGTFESAASGVVGPVTIGAGAGPNTVSGTITIPTTPTGPLYAGVYNSCNRFYFARIASPSMSQPYVVSGVPGGYYQFFAVVDMNNDGILDAGDLSIGLKNAYQLIEVSADVPGWDATLSAGNAIVYVNTNHYHWQSGPDTTDYYSLKFEVDSNRKRPVNVVLFSGPNVPVPLDIMRPSLSNPMAYTTWIKSGATGTIVPSPGDLYTYKVAYSDGTSEILSASVTAVLDIFAQNLGVVTSPSRTVPTFSWSAPASPPGPYTYAVEVLPTTGSSWYWLYPQNMSGMSSSHTTAQFNIDVQQGVPASLTVFTPYVWTVFVMDGNGNLAQSLSSYIPALAP